MKRKTLIRAAALALTAALLFTGCTARTPEENPESSGSSQNSMAEPEKTASSGTKAAAVAVPLENAPSLVPMPEERPYLYEENGSYGIRAADGSVLVPAEYAFGYDFNDNGLGQLRKDVGEEITWYKVGLDGTLLGDVNDTVVQTGAGPVVVVEKWNDDSSEGVFQLMNLNLEPLLPKWAEYLYHTNYYAGEENRFFLRMPGGKLVEFLPEEMALLEFEPYDESRAELGSCGRRNRGGEWSGALRGRRIQLGNGGSPPAGSGTGGLDHPDRGRSSADPDLHRSGPGF